jgi:hypothetical protein
MSARLVKDTGAHHTFQDDLESSFWVLLWTVLMFSKSSLDIKSLSMFVRSTFEWQSCRNEKRNVLVFQTELTPDLFPDRPILCSLLQELANLFKGIYYTPSEDEFKSYDSIKATLKGTPELSTYLQFNSTHQKVTSVERLKNHEYVISCFRRYLDKEWPSGDRAEAQSLTRISSSGEEDGRVVLSSKHILSRVYDEDRERKRRKTGNEGSSVS